MEKLKIFEEYEKYKDNTKEEIENIDENLADELFDEIHSEVDYIYSEIKEVIDDIEARNIRDALIDLWHHGLTLEELEEAILEEEREIEKVKKIKEKIEEMNEIKEKISEELQEIENPTYENYLLNLLN